MEEITIFIEWIQKIGFIGILVILAVPPLRTKIFGFNGEAKHIKEEITRIADRLTKHMDDEDKAREVMNKNIARIDKGMAYITGLLKGKK